MNAVAIKAPAVGHALAPRGECVGRWEEAPRGVIEVVGALEARVVHVVGFRVVEAVALGEFAVVGVDCRVAPRHLIDEAELTAPGRSLLWRGTRASEPGRPSGGPGPAAAART